LTSSKTLQKVHQRSQERLSASERSAPLFPSKKIVQYNSPANRIMDGIFNLFGIQTKFTKSNSNKDTFRDNLSPSNSNNPRSHPTSKEEKTSEVEIEGKQKNNDVTMMQYGGH
jgi:hypothetical protein